MSETAPDAGRAGEIGRAKDEAWGGLTVGDVVDAIRQQIPDDSEAPYRKQAFPCAQAGFGLGFEAGAAAERGGWQSKLRLILDLADYTDLSSDCRAALEALAQEQPE